MDWSMSVRANAIPIGRQIFCNRSLNMNNIVAVGFDMDYTLAQYKPETFASLVYEETITRLVNNFKYPDELLGWSFNWKYMVRGLVLDKKRGNILKMDCHKYVKVAYHGFREMSKQEKVDTYGSTLIRDAFDGPDYALIDTLFSLAEAYLFAQLVDFKDTSPNRFHSDATYAQMYEDVRSALDIVHQDGTLKMAVIEDPSRYINDDKSLVPMLRMLRDSGRTIFLVTNSLWDYTNIVMNFLCRPYVPSNIHPSFDWLLYFDVVITGSAKPKFFNNGNCVSLFEVVPELGTLVNTGDGGRVPQIGNNEPVSPPETMEPACRVFQGGNVAHLHKLLKIVSSSQVLYVGGHIYEDILGSKKNPGWRTMLIVPELEREVYLLSELKDMCRILQQFRKDRDCIEGRIEYIRRSLQCEDPISYQTGPILSMELRNLEEKMESHLSLQSQTQRLFHNKFHPVWGQLMRTGYQSSRFAHQVERFACLYTSQVTNLCLYSSDKNFRPSESFMSHEFEALGDPNLPSSAIGRITDGLQII